MSAPVGARQSTLYVDSSALVKLVVFEPETRPLRVFLRRWPSHPTSARMNEHLIPARRGSSPQDFRSAE